jgi:hypothetical protein
MEERGEITQGIMTPLLNPDKRMQHGVASERTLALTGREERNLNPAFAKPSAAVAPGKGTEIMLRFQVDPQTRQVTIFVLDKTHRNVIRTIPPEEMRRLKVGEIVDLFV